MLDDMGCQAGVQLARLTTREHRLEPHPRRTDVRCRLLVTIHTFFYTITKSA